MNCLILKWAVNEARTRDPQLGKLVLYQLSYYRILANVSGLRNPMKRWCKGKHNFYISNKIFYFLMEEKVEMNKLLFLSVRMSQYKI